MTYDQLVAALSEGLTTGLRQVDSPWADKALTALNRFTPSEWTELMDLVCEPISAQLGLREEDDDSDDD